MTATLNVQFTDPTDLGSLGPGPVVAALTQAFQEWTRHFDYTAGAYTINVSFGAVNQPLDVSLAGYDNTKVAPGRSDVGVFETTFGLDFVARGTTPPAKPTLFMNSGYLIGLPSLRNAMAPIERELGHALGITALHRNVLSYFTRPPPPTRSVYDGSVAFVQGPPNTVTTFNGPNAEAVYGGPVPVVSADPDTTMVGGGATVTTIIQGASTLQPLDIALLRDAGLPALTDQELREHQVARLYVAAFGRNADGAGLVVQYSALRNGESLQQIADGLLSSAEYANRYGTPSSADFLTRLYLNTAGHAPSAADLQFFLPLLQGGYSRGTALAAFSDGDEARGYLSANPNLTYAGTAEAQVARMYDAAFGRDADPTGFNTFVPAVINNTSLQQVALSFLGSAEFANRYGATASDTTLVDALYANTLHRPADVPGEALYVRALGSGQLSRADLLVAFSESQEHVNLVAQRASARDAAGYNLDLLPHLGIIPVIGAPITV